MRIHQVILIKRDKLQTEFPPLFLSTYGDTRVSSLSFLAFLRFLHFKTTHVIYCQVNFRSYYGQNNLHFLLRPPGCQQQLDCVRVSFLCFSCSSRK